MKICAVFTFVLLVQFCAGARFVRDAANHPILSIDDVYDGEIDAVRSALNGRLQPEKLDRFVNVVRRFNKDTSNYSRTEGTFELFAILAAAKSTGEEISWYNSLTEYRYAVLSPSEQAADEANAKSNDRFKLFKLLVRSRVPNAQDAQHILSIFGELQDGLESLEGWFGRLTFGLFSGSEYKKGQRDLAIAVLAVLAERPESEISTWISQE